MNTCSQCLYFGTTTTHRDDLGGLGPVAACSVDPERNADLQRAVLDAEIRHRLFDDPTDLPYRNHR